VILVGVEARRCRTYDGEVFNVDRRGDMPARFFQVRGEFIELLCSDRRNVGAIENPRPVNASPLLRGNAASGLLGLKVVRRDCDIAARLGLEVCDR